MNSELRKLEVLTEQLGTLTRLPAVEKERVGEFVRWEVENGECFGISLKHKDEVAVVDSFMSAGTVFPRHSHKQFETLHIYEGECTVEVGGFTANYKAPAVVRFKPNETHLVTAVTNVWLIGVTVPADRGYPSERRE